MEEIVFDYFEAEDETDDTELVKMTSLVQTAGSLIFSICNLFDLFNLKCCIRSLCFETSKTFFTLENINLSGPLFWEVKKYTMLATNSRPRGC